MIVVAAGDDGMARVAHQVFLSYAKGDADSASHVCVLLEQEGINCWLASRDAATRKDKAAANLQAIRDSELVLLIFSASANSSTAVLREIERAIAYERPVLSIHLDDAGPNASLEFYLNLWQWLDASRGIDDKRDDIVAAVKGQLAQSSEATEWRWLDAPEGLDGKREEIIAAVRGQLAESARSAEVPVTTKEAGWRRLGRKKWLITAGALAALALALGLGLGLGLAGTDHTGRWTRLDPSGTAPPARICATMVRDPVGERLILFGGNTGDAFLGDTWAYDPAANSWTELKPTGTLPSPRHAYAIGYDPAGERLIMFGGVDRDATVEGEDWVEYGTADTWAYDPVNNVWTDLKPAGPVPSPRLGQAMAYDGISGRLIMFGGQTVTTDPVSGIPRRTWVNDTWAYDPATNTWADLQPTGSLPPGRFLMGMAQDPSSERVIMFGGAGGQGGFNDTWAYHARENTWVDLHPTVHASILPMRMGCAMTYDPSSQRMIMFGGRWADSSRFLDDTWAYDPAANSWTELRPAGTAPGPHYAASLVYAPPIQRLIMFGGGSSSRNVNDTWAFTY